MSILKVLLSDDHEFFREGVKAIIRSKLSKNVTVVGEASNGLEAIEAAKLLQPDVVLMDIQMPLMDGIRATRELHKIKPQIGIIALSTFNDNAMIDAMLEAGAKGFILKNTSAEELLRAIMTVSKGGYHITQDSFLEREPTKDGPNTEVLKKVGLTEREIDVVRLLCDEMTNKEIAAALKIDVRSVETHRDHIMKKLGVKNGIGIAIYASKAGIV